MFEIPPEMSDARLFLKALHEQCDAWLEEHGERTSDVDRSVVESISQMAFFMSLDDEARRTLVQTPIPHFGPDV